MNKYQILSEEVLGDLEKALEDYDNSESNITQEELKKVVVDYKNPNGNITFRGKTCPKKPSFYFYFPRAERGIVPGINDNLSLRINLDHEAYGFGTEETTINPRRINLALTNKDKEAYERLIEKKRIGVSELLETVGSIINNSMEYDFDKIIDLESGSEKNIRFYKALRTKYKQEGKKPLKGICTDSGKKIREVLRSLNINDKIKFMMLSSSNYSEMIAHDTTLVFNRDSGIWAVINSKSPTKDYNLVPKERLYEMGSPYSN